MLASDEAAESLATGVVDDDTLDDVTSCCLFGYGACDSGNEICQRESLRYRFTCIAALGIKELGQPSKLVSPRRLCCLLQRYLWTSIPVIIILIIIVLSA
jgi:hypothetical protein